MHPADIDASLRAAEPPRETLEDGFSPPPREGERPEAARAALPPEPKLGDQSPF